MIDWVSTSEALQSLGKSSTHHLTQFSLLLLSHHVQLMINVRKLFLDDLSVHIFHVFFVSCSSGEVHIILLKEAFSLSCRDEVIWNCPFFVKHVALQDVTYRRDIASVV